MAYKQDKISVSILKYVSDILQFEVKSPDIGFITVTGVEVTNDLSYAKIFVSFLDKSKVNLRMEALERVKGFIRSSLAQKLTIRKVPTLIFVYDDSYEKGEKIEKILKEIKQKQD
ncbi:MAG: 30S ribosome-binding factor RbfA [Erysipelotrichales bacterium]|nr:30S ribosome-binding factor RbfA [Bacilli bacterium]MDD4123533.1 30S ribosome-binding factor RbfA [Bacilli bacterium]MDD4584522.1 30S ribosome-binding factor RbfA [Bacilli bacterium]MEA4822449.1 30S ribosome-binding factor RbfA [Erysipelotrichales bacterium]